MSISVLYACLIGIFLSAVLFHFGKKAAPKIGMVDKPGGRKKHEGAIPVIGGVVIIPIYFALIYFAPIPSGVGLLPLLFGTFMLLIIGAWDDRKNIKPWFRFVLQIWIACYVVVFCQAELTHLGDLFGFGQVNLGFLSQVFSVTCLVLLMNAMNMMDGIDGLAGGFVAVSLSLLFVVAWDGGATDMMLAIIFLLIPLFVFLLFNARYPFHKKASIFLGDAGALSLALIMGWFAIHTVIPSEFNSTPPSGLLSPVLIIWIMTVPIIETFSIFFTRMKQGRSPFEADRLHLHCLLQDKGWKPAYITPFILLIGLVTGLIGYLALKFGVPDYVLLYSWSALLLGITYFRLKKFGK